ncbi:MAG: NAD+ synthase [Thermomicrobiales bacterium]
MPDQNDVPHLANSIADWLREARAAAGADGFVLGLSGGVDSATVCGLCVRAAGAANVLGAIMPSASNPLDAEHARLVAERFGVDAIEVGLSLVTESLAAALSPTTEWRAPADRARLAAANVKPRLRMTTLYYLANLRNALVVGTGNKSEAMIGYFTKYGDGGVDLLPIVDLYKHEVRALAAELGVPEPIITKPPSAGLWPGQTDEGEIGLSYDELDRALAAIERQDVAAIPPAHVERIQSMMRGSEHKRQPVPAYHRDA